MGPSRGRGAIQKREARPRHVRLDKDGDLRMDTGSPVARPKTARKPLLVTTLQVHGLKDSKAATNSDGGLRSLEGFLERKASAKARDSKSNSNVKIRKSHIRGDLVFITASPDDVEQMLKLDGFTFAGATLKIKASDRNSPRKSPPGKSSPGKSHSAKPPAEKKKVEYSAEAVEIMEKFKAILHRRYQPDLKLLDLSGLEQDPGLIAMGLGTLEGKTASKLFPAMMKVCDDLFDSPRAKIDAIVSVSLAGNALSDVTNVSTLAQTFPDLKNLDLSGNNIAAFKGLRAWRWKFRNLENLVLSGNPLETQVPDYNVEIMKWFPKLLLLNGIQVRDTPTQNIPLQAINAEHMQVSTTPTLNFPAQAINAEHMQVSTTPTLNFPMQAINVEQNQVQTAPIQSIPTQALNAEQQQQEMFTKQLVEATGMTSEYAIMCLTETGWNLEKAWDAFNENKSKLPPNAFLANVVTL